ncbi:MAG: hypothetical protein H7287_12210 [Thermoleophilia bacterium]|nr:hypothetical protein [Thermoleophilia bacterium]
MDLGEWNNWWKHFGIPPVRHMLLLYWDPIDIYGTPEAADEYDGYYGGIGSLLRQGSSVDELASYLADIELNQMGSTPSHQSRNVASKIMDWFNDAMKAMDENPRAPVTDQP